VRRNDEWKWINNKENANKNFLKGRWAKGEPNGKTDAGHEIFREDFSFIAYAAMDANGKLRDVDPWTDYFMCVCEKQIP
jgi:hypothetical protein